MLRKVSSSWVSSLGQSVASAQSLGLVEAQDDATTIRGPSRPIENSSSTLRASPTAARGTLQGLFDVRLEPWEVHDPEEASYTQQVLQLRRERVEENSRMEEQALLYHQRNLATMAAKHDRQRPLRDPFALSENDMASTSRAHRAKDSLGERAFPDDDEDIEEVPVSLTDNFVPLRRFTND